LGLLAPAGGDMMADMVRGAWIPILIKAARVQDARSNRFETITTITGQNADLRSPLGPNVTVGRLVCLVWGPTRPNHHLHGYTPSPWIQAISMDTGNLQG
jgi:hypothetical protein